VPLFGRAVAILKELAKIQTSDFVFSLETPVTPISCRRLWIAGVSIVAHRPMGACFDFGSCLYLFVPARGISGFLSRSRFFPARSTLRRVLGLCGGAAHQLALWLTPPIWQSTGGPVENHVRTSCGLARPAVLRLATLTGDSDFLKTALILAPVIHRADA
jgi:hypothetical protein